MKNLPARSASKLPDDISMRLFFYLALLVPVVAVAFRAWGLNSRPIWMDESFTYLVSKLPIRSIAFNQIDNHPPLFYILQRLWYLLDPRVSAVRVPAAICGSLAVVTTMLATSDLFSRRAGVIAGAFLALSTGHIYFSQDARMYPLLSLGVSIAIWGMAGLMQRPDRKIRYAIIYCVGALIAIYAQAVSLLFLAALNSAFFAYTALSRSWRSMATLILVNVVLFLPAIPWLLSLPTAIKTFAGLGQHNTLTAFWFFMNMVSAPALQTVFKRIFFIVALVGMCAGCVCCWANNKKALAIAIFSSLFVYPLFLLLLNLHQSILENRVFIPCCVASCISLSVAVSSVRSNIGRAVFNIAICFTFIISSISAHYLAVKPENNEIALQEASVKGYRGAPVIACGFLGASSVYLNSPNQPVYFLDKGSLVKFDDRFYSAIAMSMYNLQRADASILGPYIGDASDSGKNVLQILLARRAVLISSVCNLREEAQLMRSLGFIYDQHVSLPQPPPIFGSMWTQVDLFRAPPLSKINPAA